MSTSRGELLTQRDALVRVIQDLVDWTDEEATANALSGTIRLIDELLAADGEGQQDIYVALRETAERFGWVGEYADEKLEEAAQAMMDDPQNQEDDE